MMIAKIFLTVLSILKIDSVDLTIDNVEVVDNQIAIDIRIENNSDDPLVIYEPTLECMINGILSVELLERGNKNATHELYPFDVIRDVDRIFLTDSNAVLVNKMQPYTTRIKVPLSGQKGRFKLLVTLNYADVRFEFNDIFSTDNVLDEVLQAEMNIKIK